MLISRYIEKDGFILILEKGYYFDLVLSKVEVNSLCSYFF